MLHCFSAIHSSCLKVPASKGEEDTFPFLFCAHLRLCESLCECETRRHALNKTNTEDPRAKQCPRSPLKQTVLLLLTFVSCLSFQRCSDARYSDH